MYDLDNSRNTNENFNNKARSISPTRENKRYEEDF